MVLMLHGPARSHVYPHGFHVYPTGSPMSGCSLLTYMDRGSTHAMYMTQPRTMRAPYTTSMAYNIGSPGTPRSAIVFDDPDEDEASVSISAPVAISNTTSLKEAPSVACSDESTCSMDKSVCG
mmetsp:Transcript_39832/g.105595  ORF Transcript_39832/g.105595 Transcript_39832/m.105595 type:complete len:123 (+) Transcript_39832:121-489(+)